MVLSPRVCVSLGWLPVEKLIEWGDSKKEFCELVNESSFQKYISVLCDSVRKYYQDKGIKIGELQEEKETDEKADYGTGRCMADGLVRAAHCGSACISNTYD